MATIVVRRICGRNPFNAKLFTRTSCIVTNVKSPRVLNIANVILQRNIMAKHIPLSSYSFIRRYSDDKQPVLDTNKKLTLFQKFKQMYRDYWYVLVPVHIVTSIGWFGGFYYLAKSGIDIVAIMENWHVSERIISPLRDSSMGYLAVSYALYKIATPIRYAVTLGGTTFSINYLKNLGYIKPVPSAQELKVMYTEKRDHMIGTLRSRHNEYKLRKSLLKEKNHFKVKKESLMNGHKRKVKSKTVDTENKKT